jgi:uncharacterized SAM-binding protein YcdF (DUF218 family)
MLHRPAFRTLAKVAAVALALTAFYVVVTFVQVWHATGQDDARPADAIIVLGAAQYDGEPSPVLKERLDHAHELWSDDLAPTIVVTGGRQEGDRFTEATASYNYLRGLGVPDEEILKEVDGTNTWEQLAASARFLGESDMTDVILVTDDYHAYRVEAIAGELGLDAAVSPVRSTQSTVSRIKLLTKETAAVAVGRFIGFRRLVNLDEAVTS